MTAKKRTFGAKTRTVDLSRHLNWPDGAPEGEWWKNLAASLTAQYPPGVQSGCGIPFRMGSETDRRVILLTKDTPAVAIPLRGQADYLCFVHRWEQLPPRFIWEQDDPTRPVQGTPTEVGKTIGEYVVTYSDGSTHLQRVRSFFEVDPATGAGATFCAVPFRRIKVLDHLKDTGESPWGMAQMGYNLHSLLRAGPGLIYALPNPHPEKSLRSLTLRGLDASPLVIAGITLYQGSSHPLRELPRRRYRVQKGGKALEVEKAEVDMGDVLRIERTKGQRDAEWLKSPYAGTSLTGWGRGIVEPERNPEDVIEVYGTPDATVSVTVKSKEKPLHFSLGEAFHHGESRDGAVAMEALGRQRQWMRVKVIDSATGQPTAVRLHMSGSRGEYIAPYGHQEQINTNFFEDYGADLVIAGRSHAYVAGDFTTDLPVGDLYVELYKGFEYEPLRTKVTIRPGQKELLLKINRWKDLRSAGWVTADTHVHFMSPTTAWLEGQCEGINVVNVLATQLGRLFTNVGDYRGRIGAVEDDTVVQVGTENREHLLGHMSLLGTKGDPVYPMCGGGPSEAFMGDPDFRCMAEWALESRRKGGIVILPHFPVPNGEHPVAIVKELAHALELGHAPRNEFRKQEWYRYLNCGYKVAVCGGTDKMGADIALGWVRTYAKLDPNKPFTYDAWTDAIRAGRTFTSSGALIDMSVDGKAIGDTITMSSSGGTVEVCAIAESFWPLGRLEIVQNGRVIAATEGVGGAKKLTLRENVRIENTGWIAARCQGLDGHPASYIEAHSSPIYVNCGTRRAFDGPAAMHMLALVEGVTEYMENLAMVFDEPSRKRMVKIYREVQRELKSRIKNERQH